MLAENWTKKPVGRVVISSELPVHLWRRQRKAVMGDPSLPLSLCPRNISTRHLTVFMFQLSPCFLLAVLFLSAVLIPVSPSS